MSQPLRVLVADERGRPAAAGLARWLARVAPSRVRGTVNIAMVSDATVRALNQRYRGVDDATDVLSFPVEPPPRTRRTRGAESLPWRQGTSASPASSASSSLFLGDIVIAQGVARRQARAARHAEAIEHRVLALHGLLHLIGYDHERDDGRMRRVEQRLRRKGRLREGLIERAGAPRPAAGGRARNR
ncbi:MAG: rRNA maturation RNase YbeY [Acidobacteriota bacterium]